MVRSDKAFSRLLTLMMKNARSDADDAYAFTYHIYYPIERKWYKNPEYGGCSDSYNGTSSSFPCALQMED